MPYGVRSPSSSRRNTHGIRQSGGHGIYLVLWFGAGPAHMRVVSPRGDVPGSPEELKRLLEAQLPPALTETIHVVVIDVSPAGRYAEEQAALASA